MTRFVETLARSLPTASTVPLRIWFPYQKWKDDRSVLNIAHSSLTMRLLILFGLITIAAAYLPIRGKVVQIDEDLGPCLVLEYILGYRVVEFKACQTYRELAPSPCMTTSTATC